MNQPINSFETAGPNIKWEFRPNCGSRNRRVNQCSVHIDDDVTVQLGCRGGAGQPATYEAALEK